MLSTEYRFINSKFRLATEYLLQKNLDNPGRSSITSQKVTPNLCERHWWQRFCERYGVRGELKTLYIFVLVISIHPSMFTSINTQCTNRGFCQFVEQISPSDRLDIYIFLTGKEVYVVQNSPAKFAKLLLTYL